jgi:hypothetical protein
VKNIGDGVQDFFYEPYMGLMQSPTDFGIGVVKGTGTVASSLIQHHYLSASHNRESSSWRSVWNHHFHCHHRYHPTYSNFKV